MHVRAKVQSHKDKLKKETNNDNLNRIHKPRTPEVNRPMISHFNSMNKCGRKVSNQGDVDYYKQTDSVKNQNNKKRGNMNS